MIAVYTEIDMQSHYKILYILFYDTITVDDQPADDDAPVERPQE